MTFLTSLPAFLQLVLLMFAVVGLWYGSENVIWGVKRLARKFGISELIIGLTIVSIGSSLPEIFVNVSAGLRGADSIGVGNIVGSCFVQISFILGICVLIGGAMSENRANLKRDGALVLGSILLLFLAGLDGVIATWEAIILMLLYVVYIYMLLAANRFDPKVKKSVSNTWINLGAFLWGAFLVWLSAEVLITIGLHAGEQVGLNQGIIGLLSGIGTSIPELSISLVALLRKSSGISVGNLLGSNITDPLLSLGIGAALAGGYTVSNFLLFTAIPIWAMASAFAIGVFWFAGKMTRLPAMLLMLFYFGAFWWFLV